MSATQIAGSITDPTQIATLQSLGNDIAGAVTPSVAPNTFVFWAGFNGTNNTSSNPSYSGDTQTTAIGALRESIARAGAPNVIAREYDGVGTPGTLPGSSVFPTEQAVATATQAYNEFAAAAETWLQTNPGGSVTSMLASFSRGSIAAAVFSQMLYEKGLVALDGTMLVPPGQVGVSAGLIISPVNTGGVGDVPFAPNAQNMVEIVAANEYRVAYEQDIYGGFNKVVYWPGNHGDVGGFYPGGLGAIYLQDYTDYFNAVNPGMAGAVLPNRQYQGGAVDIHVETFSLSNPQNLPGGSYADGSRIGTSNINPLGSSSVTSTGDTYTYVNYKGETIVMERVGGVIQSITRTPPSQVGGLSVVDYQISSPTGTLATANPDGSATVVAKNAAGTILQSTTTFANGDIEQVSYTNGVPSSVTRSGTIASDGSKVVSLYDAAGTVLQVTVTSHVVDNGVGMVTTSQIVQDGTGALVRVVESVQDVNAGTNTTTSFNISNGTVDGKTITIYNSASGEITRNKLDTNDVLLSSTIQFPSGEVNITSYESGAPISVTKRLTDAATGGVTEYVFDGTGNVLQSVSLFDRNNAAGMTLTLSADGGFVYNDQQAAELGSSGAFINQLASGMAAAEIAGVFTPADYNGVIRTSVTEGSSGNLIADITFQSQWSNGQRLGSITTVYQNNIVTQTVATTLNGNTVNVTYTYDPVTGEPIPHVNNINGQPPTDQAAADAALRQSGVGPGQLVFGDAGVAGTGAGGVISTFDGTTPTGAQTLADAITTYAPTLIDALSLIKAIQSGDPLPVTVSGLRLANDLLPKYDANGTPIASSWTISGAANVGSGILSLMSLDAALKRGDTLASITAGAQTLSFGARAYVDLALNGKMVQGSALSNFMTDLNGLEAVYDTNYNLVTPGQVGILPALNLVNSIANGDGVGAAIGTLQIANSAGWMAVPGIGQIAMAYTVFNMITSLFGDDTPPEAWGSAHATWNGFNAVTNAAGGYGGLETATQTYNGVLSYLDQLAAQEQAINPGSPIGIVANRLPSLSYRNYTGYQITDIDPLTGEQRNPGVLYDLTGRPYNAPAGSVQASQSLSERMIRVALERGAVAPLWEVQTAALQTQQGDPMAGLTEEERAGRAGLLATQPPQPPQPPLSGGSQTFRPVALDLNGDGVQTTGSNRTAAFNVDDTGYLKETAWLNNNDGFLFLDRNLNGQIDGGRELFSNSVVALSERGLKGMRWIDSNYDGSLSALDPVWDELKVWQDADGDGANDAGETKTLAALGITSLNYAMGTFTQNGQIKQLASPDLIADTEGTLTYAVPEGIIVRTSQGHTSLLATRIDDRSVIEANRDGVTGYEDTELIISAADLLANDTLAGLSGQDLSITGVSGFTHGTGFLDNNGFVHYTPQANYFGAASFNYSILASTGQTDTATVDLTVQNVNDAPVATLDQHLRAIYGYMSRSQEGKLGSPQYAPYTGPDYSNSAYWAPTYGYHATPVAYEDTDGPNKATIVVTDPDDPAGSFTFAVAAQAQKGEGSVDASGNISYTNWYGPNMPGEQPDQQHNQMPSTSSTQPDPFTVRVTDPHGASATVQVTTVHKGSYNPSLGSGGGKKPISIDLGDDGFGFTDIDDSSIFFDVNGDGFKRRTAWPSAGDGLLAFDADGNGLIDNGGEIGFVGYLPDAQTDLQGLAAFDSNDDGIFSALDARWSKFGVWQDIDQDGVTDAGEFKTLDELGIAAVNLTSDGQFQVIDGQTVHGIGSVTKADGSTLDLADVTLAYGDEVLVANADGSASVAVKPPFAPNGETVTGTAGKDLLLGNNGNTIIEALEGDDVVMSDIGNDVIDGGAGNDLIYAGGGNDLVIAGEGDDVVFAGLGDDVVLGGDGHDALLGEGGNDVIFGGAGNDLVSGGDGNNVLSGDAGDDQVYGGTGNDALFGGDGNDELAGMEGYDLLDGGAGNDLLDGGAQDDVLSGGAGDDTLIGGAGNDALDGGIGNDTYVFGRGAGQDTISDTDATAGNTDTIKFGADILASDVTVTRDVNNLYLAINPSAGSGQATDKLTLKDWFAGDAAKVERATFADGMVWDLSERAALLSIPTEGDDFLVGTAGDDFIEGLGGNDTLAGLAGDDYLQGGSGNDTYLFGRGAGQDYVHEYDTTPGNTDIVQIAPDVAPADVKVTRDADNLFLGIKGTDDKMTLLGWFTGDEARVEQVRFADGTVWDVATLATKAADTTLNAEGGNSTILGTAANDTLVGNTGNNLLDGGAGADTMVGGAGDDDYRVDNASDLVIEYPNEGNDSVHASIGYTLTANVENLTLIGSSDLRGTGNALDNFINGNYGDNLLDGGYGADTLNGGVGDDTYVVDNAGDRVVENPGAGNDTVLSGISYRLTSNVENLTLTGSADISAEGNASDNAITGNSGNNRINGGAGADVMAGGAGNDTYLVDNAADMVVEAADAGLDTVQVGFDYTLGDNVESLVLTGADNLNGTGNALNNLLNGNAGDNVLDGGAGADAMQGGAGNDIYIVDNAGDVVLEDADGGVDTVQAGVTYTLAAEVENMVLTGDQAIDATGNVLDNAIAGNDAANVLSGLGGNDTLTANGGNDRLDGGLGADDMRGGAGDDTYVVDDAGDLVVEGLNAGADTVESGITYTLTDHVENLILTGADALDGTGNALDNAIAGNAANNVLDGAAGADTMAGGAGDDTYIVDNAADVVVENLNEGTDTVFSSASYGLSGNIENLTLTGMADLDGTGNALDNIIAGNDGANSLFGLEGNDTLLGNGGNDRLDGGLGADVMAGGAGDDTYVVENAGDLVAEGLDSGIDTVESGITYALTDNVENLFLTGTQEIDGTGNALDNAINGNDAANTLSGLDGNDTLVANGGNDRLDGGAGADTMQGGSGDDTYVVDESGDLVAESADSGIDTVESGISYALTDNVENLILTGAADIDGFGNELDNTLVGNDGNNRLFGNLGNDTLLANGGNDLLDGGTGADTMEGGSGDDIYVVDNAGDLVAEGMNSGTDQVFASISYALTDNVENLTLTGSDPINGTGNVLDNVIVGNAANNVLDGAAGADMLIGGAGDDTYIVDNAADVVAENLDEGTDIVFSSVSYGLSANVENLTLTGTADIDGFGNELDNTLVGNEGNNRLFGYVGSDTLLANGGNDLLDGGVGADSMSGGAGDDSYVVENIGDLVTEDIDAGIDTVLSGITYTLTDNVENLTLTGTGDIDGTGNVLDNILIGNSGNNLLIGLGGDDILDGGLGADVMIGGIGNDIYVVDNVGDRVVEAGGDENDDGYDDKHDGRHDGKHYDDEHDGRKHRHDDDRDGHEHDDEECTIPEYPSGGIDTVRSSITYALGRNVENLVLTGSRAINGTGNELDNILIGNAAANVLKGKDGNDTLAGNGGADILIGGEGDDTYYVDDTQSRLVEEHKEGIDTVVSSISYVLKDDFENLTLTGTQSISAAGNDLDNVLIGNEGSNILSGGDGDDTLDGGAGADTLMGGSDDDIYVVDNIGDIVIENRKAGTDTVRSSISYTLVSNVENLTLTGADSINGTGNALDNVITGNGGANVLSGLDGDDTLQGNAANDILLGGCGDDALRDHGGNNLLDGGEGKDSLSGNAGNELFAGGRGNDNISTGNGADIIVFNRGDGKDTVYGGIGTDNTLSLGGNIRYKDISLSKVNKDLVLEVGDHDQITLKDWYSTDANYKSVLNLQVVTEAMSNFDASSSDPLLNQSVQQFDFTSIVNAFDQARGSKTNESSFQHWSAMNAMLGAHLSGSGSEALGGDLAYQYGKNGTLAGMGQTAAQATIGAAQFGIQAQAIRQLPTLGSEVARLG